MTVNYSHFERSAVCASSGLFVGAKDSEVQVASASGALYHSGTALSATAAQLNRTIGGTASGYRIAAGNVCASATATVDTGLTTVTYAACSILGKCAGSKATNGTLDTINTPDSLIGTDQAVTVQHRIVSTNDLWVKCYGNKYSNATLDPATKRHKVSWIAFGT